MSPQSFDSHSISEKRSHFSTALTLFQYIWAKDRPDLKVRIVIAIIFLVAAEMSLIYSPYILKYLVDYLTDNSKNIELWAFVPVALALAYGAARLFQQVLGELRAAIFA